jgi:hypothetical protein
VRFLKTAARTSLSSRHKRAWLLSATTRILRLVLYLGR